MLAEVEDGSITNITNPNKHFMIPFQFEREKQLLRLFLVSIFMRYFLQTLFTEPAEYLFYSKEI